MNSEIKICQNCKNQFVIEPVDFSFYEKIHVPPPTFCPECRMMRRMMFRNERSLYKRPCNAPSHTEEIISMYSSVSPYTVYDQKHWWSDEWNPLQYGQAYDFDRPFFEQFRTLMRRVPLVALANVNAVNSEWCNPAADNKNTYLSFGATKNENVSYSNRVASCRDSFDLYLGDKNELCSNSLFLKGCSRVHFSMHARNCLDSWFLFDCNNCSNCIGCVGLRNKQFHIFNEPYTKEEYKKKVEELKLGSQSTLQNLQDKFFTLAQKYPHRYAHMINAIKSTGDNLENVKNALTCFDIISGMENSKYCVWGGYGWKDSYDGLGCNGELMYELIDAGSVGRTCSNAYFSIAVTDSIDVQHAYSVRGSSHLFACIGLRNQSYCILNKQYTQEEYERLVPRIIEHMNQMPYIDKKGRVYKYGEFFPSELSPFAYNETIAQEYFPLTKEQALEKGYSWKDPESRNYQIQIKNDQIPDHIKDVKDDIIGQVIECGHKGTCNEQCTEAYKIIPQELNFLRKMNLPLPRLCPNCRHYQRIKQRNPLKLWKRNCQCAGSKSDNGVYQNTASHRHGQSHCPETFETSYAPERSEIVYCEQCYNAEVV